MPERPTRKSIKGVSLIELLVVLAVFSMLAILSTRAILLSLRGSKKSESLATVRENIDFSFAVMERNLRGAQDATCPSSTRVDYIDGEGQSVYFSCESVGTDGYISSASARLTNTKIEITSCEFTCDPGDPNVPPSVTMSVSGKDSAIQGVEAGNVSISTQVFLRSY